MEISQLFTAESHENGSWVEIVNPIDGNPTDIKFLVAGIDSKCYRGTIRRILKNALDSKVDNVSVDEDETAISILTECTLGWEGVLKNGEEWEFSKANIRAVYEQSPDIRRQVEEFIGNRVNFIKG